MFKKCEECNVPQKLNKILYILAAFILVFLFSVVFNDETGLNAERRIKLPILGAELESSDAYAMGPLIIIFLTLCSHLFIQEWYNCEKDQSERNKCISKVDFIFNDLTCNILFFAITPIILFFFHISSRGKPEKFFTGMAFLAMTSILIILRFLYLKKIRQLIIIIPLLFIVTLGYFIYEKDLDIANLYPLNLRGADLKGQILLDINLKNMKAEAARFDNSNLYKQTLRGAIAKHANFNNANLFGADLTGSNFGSSKFENANLYLATLERVVLTGAFFKEVSLIYATIKEADMTGAELIDADLSNTKISKSTLVSARLNRAKFINATLSHVNFSEANLEDAKFSGSTLSSIDFSYAKLSHSKFDGAKFYEVFNRDANQDFLNSLTLEQIAEVCVDKHIIINGIELKICPPQR